MMQFEWKGSRETLFKRLKTISDRSGFSARETRVLKQLLRKEEKGQISLSEVLERFPGRTIEDINEFEATQTK